jgi:hypothetical protein
MECFGTTDFDNNSRLITLSAIIISGLHCIRIGTRFRRNQWQHEVMEDVRIVGGEDWQGKVYNREEWKVFLRTAMNCSILHMTVE